MKLLFSNFYIKINETNDWSILELGFSPYSTDQSSLINRIGLAAFTQLVSILQQKTETALPNDQKIQLIKMGFGLTTEEAQSLVIATKPLL